MALFSAKSDLFPQYNILVPTKITEIFSFEFSFSYFIHFGRLSYEDLLVMSKTIKAPDAPL